MIISKNGRKIKQQRFILAEKSDGGRERKAAKLFFLFQCLEIRIKKQNVRERK